MSDNQPSTKFSKDNPVIELASKDNQTKTINVNPPKKAKEQKKWGDVL